MDGFKLELCKFLEKEGGHEELIDYLQHNGLNYYFSNPSFHPVVQEFQILYYILYETEFANKDIFWKRYLSFDFADLLTQIVIFHDQRESNQKVIRKRHNAQIDKKKSAVHTDVKDASCSTSKQTKTNDKSKLKNRVNRL